MQRELVAEKIDVKPCIGTAALLTSEQVAIELARRSQIANVIGQMKRGLHSGFLECRCG
jgi:hypothetical protein